MLRATIIGIILMMPALSFSFCSSPAHSTSAEINALAQNLYQQCVENELRYQEQKRQQQQQQQEKDDDWARRNLFRNDSQRSLEALQPNNGRLLQRPLQGLYN